jgi:anaerobic ribonucleoside-triphosphate reductase activating protein
VTATLRLNRVAAPVRSLGFGKRAVLWVQGCALACPGCISPHTWDSNSGETIGAEELASLLLELEGQVGPLDGLTISGGEPFDQAESLIVLVETLRGLGWLGGQRDLLTYSGYSSRKLRRAWPALFDLSDAVISEPFRQDLPRVGLRGSSNQVLHANTELARRRYPPDAADPAPLEGAWLDGRILLAGVPRYGEMERFAHLLRQSGMMAALPLEDVPNEDEALRLPSGAK